MDKKYLIPTFLIGFVAGVAPFLFMKLVPEMLSSGMYQASTSYWPILVTGLLVGAITAIIFSKDFADKDPRDVFFYALGIPAVLIATITNINTEFSKVHEIEKAKNEASIVNLQPVQPKALKGVPKLLQKPISLVKPEGSASSNFSPFVSRAWAAQRPTEDIALVAQSGILVAIGRYTGEKEAWAAFERYSGERLKSETYFEKNLQVMKINDSLYILTYSSHTTMEEAERVYKILRINDPGLSVQLYTY